MSYVTFQCQPIRRLVIEVKLANQLWYSTLKEGGRRVHFAECGYYKSIQHEGCYALNLIVLWLSVRIAFDTTSDAEAKE